MTPPPSSRHRVTTSTAMTSATSPDATKPSWSSEMKWKHAFFSAAVRHGTASTRHGTESPLHHQPNLTSTSGELPRLSPMSAVHGDPLCQPRLFIEHIPCSPLWSMSLGGCRLRPPRRTIAPTCRRCGTTVPTVSGHLACQGCTTEHHREPSNTGATALCPPRSPWPNPAMALLHSGPTTKT